jgi:hypothetical protein
MCGDKKYWMQELALGTVLLGSETGGRETRVKDAKHRRSRREG